jgi:hypothetical protein
MRRDKIDSETALMDESQLRHPLERPLFSAFVLLNFVVIGAALFIAIKGSGWLAEHPFLAKHGGHIRAFAIAAVIAVPGLVFLRNTRHAQVRGNSIRLSPVQLPLLHSILGRHCERLGIDRPPDLYFSDTAIKEPARAFTSWKQEYIVLSTRFLQPDLDKMREVFAFLLGRELGRLRLGHASWSTELLLSYVTKIPYVRNPILRVFTYSEDRYGAYLAPEGVLGLVALASGRLMLYEVNVPDYLRYVQAHGGIWSRLAALTSDTPHTAFRIKNLYNAGLLQSQGTIGSESWKPKLPNSRSLEKRRGA